MEEDHITTEQEKELKKLIRDIASTDKRDIDMTTKCNQLYKMLFKRYSVSKLSDIKKKDFSESFNLIIQQKKQSKHKTQKKILSAKKRGEHGKQAE